MIRIDFFYDNIFIPVFEDKLKDYFSDMFNSDCGILFYPIYNTGRIILDSGFGQREIVFFEFLNDSHEHDFSMEIFSLLKFSSNVLLPFYFKNETKPLPQCFKKRHEFVLSAPSLKKETLDIIKKVFLKDFIHFFGLTNSYVEFDKVREKKKIDKLMGEEIF